MKISFTAVALDKPSRDLLMTRVERFIPEGWKTRAGHMTITTGPLVHPRGKHDFSNDFSLNGEVSLKVLKIGLDERALAVVVDTPGRVASGFAHITIAISPESKPRHSKEIPEENFTPFSEDEGTLTLKGIVKEFPF